MLQYWCSFRTVPDQGVGHQLQYRGFQLQRLLQEEDSYSYSYSYSYGGLRSRCWVCERWIVLSDGVAGHYYENRVPALG